MKYINTILALVCMLFGTTQAVATDNGDMLRIMSRNDSIIDNIFSITDYSQRLDMIDYYNAGQKYYITDTDLLGEIVLDTLDNNHARISTPDNLAYDFYLLADANDSIIVAVTSYSLGTTDSTVKAFLLDTAQPVQLPDIQYTDWLVNNALKSADIPLLTASIPYIMTGTEVNPDAQTITLTNNSILTPGLDQTLTAFFQPTLTLTKKGKGRNARFVIRK